CSRGWPSPCPSSRRARAWSQPRRFPSREGYLRRDAPECAEYTEVGWIGRQERLDAGLPVSRGQQRVQQSLPAQRELLQPGEKLRRRAVVGEHTQDFARGPPLLGQLPGRREVERLREAAGIGDDMDELGEYLR